MHNGQTAEALLWRVALSNLLDSRPGALSQVEHGMSLSGLDHWNHPSPAAQHALAAALEAAFRNGAEARGLFLAAIALDDSTASALAFAAWLTQSDLLEDALLVLTDAWHLARRTGDVRQVAGCCRRLADAYMNSGDMSQARRFAQRATAAEMSGWSEHQSAFSPEQLLLEARLARLEGDAGVARALLGSALALSPEDRRASIRWQRSQLAIDAAPAAALN